MISVLCTSCLPCTPSWATPATLAEYKSLLITYRSWHAMPVTMWSNTVLLPLPGLMSAPAWSMTRFDMSVTMMPGATALIRTPLRPISTATARVSASTAPLEAA